MIIFIFAAFALANVRSLAESQSAVFLVCHDAVVPLSCGAWRSRRCFGLVQPAVRVLEQEYRDCCTSGAEGEEEGSFENVRSSCYFFLQEILCCFEFLRAAVFFVAFRACSHASPGSHQ
ncbi:unnamed protein product, partial [Ectocarpus fasciculatus]